MRSIDLISSWRCVSDFWLTSQAEAVFKTSVASTYSDWHWCTEWCVMKLRASCPFWSTVYLCSTEGVFYKLCYFCCAFVFCGQVEEYIINSDGWWVFTSMETWNRRFRYIDEWWLLNYKTDQMETDPIVEKVWEEDSIRIGDSTE